MVDIDAFLARNDTPHGRLVAGELDRARRKITALSEIIRERDDEIAQLKHYLSKETTS